MTTEQQSGKIIHDPKCRKCKVTLGARGLRSMKAEDRPDDVVKKGGKFYHKECV